MREGGRERDEENERVKCRAHTGLGVRMKHSESKKMKEAAMEIRICREERKKKKRR